MNLQPSNWRYFLAVGIVAEDISAITIARCLGVRVDAAEEALDVARAECVIGPDGIDPSEAVRMVGELGSVVMASVHTAVARYLFNCGPTRILEAVAHARSAWELSPAGELLAIADLAADASLSVGDYRSARECLEFTYEYSTDDPPSAQARRLCRLATALDGLGLVADARTHLATAFQIAEFEGEADLAIWAAVEYVFPVDWYAGDRRTTGQLQRAEALATTEEHQVMLSGARAMAEMRIPVSTSDGHQVAWITRPSVAQPLADDALNRSVGLSAEVRLFALLAWRTTHRDPQFLERRREASSEAFDTAQRLRHPGRMMDAAVLLGVDALESGDRPTFDQMLTVLRWIAKGDENPRQAWHARTTAAGAAHLDGDLDAARQHREAARKLGLSTGISGWFGAELLLLSQELLSRADPGEFRQHLPDDGSTALLNPLAKLIAGVCHVQVGAVGRAEDLLRRAMRQFDPEASWLLCHTRAVELAVMLGADDVVEQLWEALEPWHDHVAVDSHAWFCDGPVSGWLAVLAQYRSDQAACRRYLSAAEPVARSLGDVRTLARLGVVRGQTGIALAVGGPGHHDLTDRERSVLQFVVDGWSNPQIAESMAFSRSTIRNALSVIYRKLGVSNRLEAASYAVRLGICQPADV
jgi:DNA-binding CsgD family transcriptional regulator